MFDVKKHLIKVQGNRLYLPVSARLVWFRQEHPDWGIETKPIVIDSDKQIAVFEAIVYNAEGKLMAKGTKMETVRGFPDYIEAAETGAIGRALAVCGFGTQFAPDLDEMTAAIIVDQPQPVNQTRYNGSKGSAYRYQSAQNGANSHENYKSGTDHQAERQSDSAENNQKDTEHECSDCGRSVTKGQEAISVRNFGTSLCPDCQKKRKTTEIAAG